MGDKLPRGLYALLDDSVRPGLDLRAAARAVVAGGAAVLQLRLKRHSDRDALALARDVVALGVPVIVNDRVDLALLSGAAGVHLGDDDLPVAAARRVLGPGALVGSTCRDLAGLRRAHADGADHAGLGPIFVTTTKHVPHPPLGLDGLAALAPQSPLPLVAIAGITLDTIGGVARAGAHCAAVAGALLEAEDLQARAAALVAAFARN